MFLIFCRSKHSCLNIEINVIFILAIILSKYKKFLWLIFDLLGDAAHGCNFNCTYYVEKQNMTIIVKEKSELYAFDYLLLNGRKELIVFTM